MGSCHATRKGGQRQEGSDRVVDDAAMLVLVCHAAVAEVSACALRCESCNDLTQQPASQSEDRKSPARRGSTGLLRGQLCAEVQRALSLFLSAVTSQSVSQPSMSMRTEESPTSISRVNL